VSERGTGTRSAEGTAGADTLESQPSRTKRVFEAQVKDLESQLSSFDSAARDEALGKLIALRIPVTAERQLVNVHMHTFHSYNADNWSPSRFAWEAHKAGLWAAGIIDFDDINGVQEFLLASERLSLRATAGIEIRTFMEPFGKVDIDSPGEPGVHYMAGSGMMKAPKAGSPEAAYLEGLRKTSEQRARDLVARINEKVPEIAVDFNLVKRTKTPAGYISERHLVTAYVERAQAAFPVADRCAEYWAKVFGMEKAAVAALFANPAALEEKVRGKLMKKGGLGYEQPGPSTFPPTGEVYAWVKACGGVPMDSWLDGTSEGEKRAVELLECNRSLGARALNLIPDRNWNLKNPEDKQRKLENLARVVALAVERHMPLHIGTEGNKAGLPFVDDLDGADLAPYKSLVLEGSRILIGHALLARFADFPYAGDAAEDAFRRDYRAMNLFFSSVGALPPLDAELSRRLRDAGTKTAHDILRASAQAGRWTGLGTAG
jgi:hypothetical protein